MAYTDVYQISSYAYTKNIKRDKRIKALHSDKHNPEYQKDSCLEPQNATCIQDILHSPF
jgi:hypothetical protein